ncbi:MAG TPA: tRNA threonylcarbamoyladenosine biosynthesis protein RimN, partial [Lysobacter sp.]
DLSPALLALVDGVCEGETGGREAPSTIRDAASGAVLRG